MAEQRRPTTGRISSKPYRCTACGHISQIGTNHWGECYSSCVACSWKRPGQPTVQECLEPPPEGYGIPEKWKIVKLGDLIKMEDK